MYCPDCGSVINDTDRFCGKCGRRVDNIKYQRTTAPIYDVDAKGNTHETKPKQKEVKKENNAINICALIFSFVVPLVGFILGIIGLKKSDRESDSGRGLAIAAIVISIIVFVVQLASFITQLPELIEQIKIIVDQITIA